MTGRDTDPRLRAAMHNFDLAVIVVVRAGVAWLVWHKVRKVRRG